MPVDPVAAAVESFRRGWKEGRQALRRELAEQAAADERKRRTDEITEYWHQEARQVG